MEKLSRLEKLTPKSDYLVKGTAKVEDKQVSYTMRCQCGQYMEGNIEGKAQNQLIACPQCDKQYNIIPKLEVEVL